MIEKAPLIAQFPALSRPISMRLVDLLNQAENVTPEMLLKTTMTVPQVAQALTPAILALGPQAMLLTMTTSKDQNIRRQAAAYLATMAQTDPSPVAAEVIRTYQFDPQAKAVPWEGGPLFIPGIAWDKDQAGQLVEQLISWVVWSDLHDRTDLLRQLHNNLRSRILAELVGFETPNFQFAGSTEWLEVWGRAVGKERVRALLEEQNAMEIPKYARVLAEL